MLEILRYVHQLNGPELLITLDGTLNISYRIILRGHINQVIVGRVQNGCGAR